MAFSDSCRILWLASVIFVILPHFNLGLLSDYKICRDSECESPMSRVQAKRDHRGKDCRFLSFRRGDTIIVYHKLTGKREDLWAGTIDRQFGYFPKDAVQEEQVYAAADEVMETQKSDFICMDEHGYPIDSSHLDNTDKDGNDDQNIQTQEPETIQTIVHTDDSSAEHPSASIDSPSEYPDQPDATSSEEDKKQKSDPNTSATREDTHETPAALAEQGGSPSSSWLGSSVTGWLGLGNEEQNDNMPEREEPQEEVSLTSSVTGWLGFGGEKKLDDTVNSREEDKEVGASFTSTMTGWLGLGGEKEADHATKEQREEREIDDTSEPKETFRSRRMSLDLEGSQLQEEEKEVGTLGWLGKGLTSTLGFGATNLETDPIKEEKEKPASSSWLDIGVGDILGFGKSESKVDESSRSNFKETERDSTQREASPSDQAEESQSVQEEQKTTKPDAQRVEEKPGMETSTEIGDDTISSSSSTDTNESNVEEHVVDNFSPLELASVTLTLEEDVTDDSVAVSDASEGASPPVDVAATGVQENLSPQTTSEENLQALDGTPPRTDVEGSAEATGEGHQLHRSTGNGFGNNSRELEVEGNKSASDDREIIIEPDADLGSDLNSMESKGQYVENTDRAEHVEDDGVKTTKQVEREESTMVGLELVGNNDSQEKSDAEKDKHYLGIYPTLKESEEISRDEESRGQLSSSSDTHKEKNGPTHRKEDSGPAHSVKTDNLDRVVTAEDSKREGESYNAGVQNVDVHSASGPSMYVNPPQDQMLIIQSNDCEAGSPQNEEVITLKEKQEEFEVKRVEERKEKEMQDEVHKLQKTEKQEDVKKEEKKQGEMKDEERNPDRKEELKKEEIQKEVNDIHEEMRQEESGKGGENTKHEVNDVKEEEKGDEEMVDSQGESEKSENEQDAASVEEQTQHEVESVEEEKKMMEVKEEEKQDKTKEFQVEEKEAEVEKFRKGKEEKEQQDEARQQIIAGSKQEEEEEIRKSKEQEQQEKLSKLNDSKEEGKETTVQVPHLETHNTNIQDIFKPELEISEEIHDDNTKTDENKREEEQVKREETQQLADVEEDRRDKEEEESQKCSNKPGDQAAKDEPAGVRNEKPKSTGDSMIQQKRSGVVVESETMSSEGTGPLKTDRLREGEADDASDDSDEGEEGNVTLNATGNENTYSNVNIPNHNDLKVEQIRVAPHTDNDQHSAGESGHSGGTRTSLVETWDPKEHDHQEKNDIVSQGPFNSDANSRVKVENESSGAFGLFKNAFSYFSQTPASETKEPTASTPSVDTNTAETATPQAFLPVEQASDSTQFKPNSKQVPVQEIHKHSPVSISTHQHTQPSPASAPSPSPETKSLSKYYKNLLGHVSGEELAYLLDLFGRNKLQFLDYILGSSESQTDDPDNDESILSDIKRLLHHHKETLATSNEVNENTQTLIALQKLEILLKKLSERFNTRKSDVSKATLQADASCVGGSCSTNAKDEKEPKGIQDLSKAKETKAQRDDGKAEERDKVQAGGVTEQSREDDAWEGPQKETQTHPHIQPGSPQPQEGIMKQSLDFVHQFVTVSITCVHATREVLIGITAKVVSSLPDDIRPGPDLYGLPWEPVIISSFVGLVTVLLFTCRCYSSVKSRMYRSKERRMAEQVAQLLEEKCKVLETLSKCQQEYGELEESLRDRGVLVQTQKTEQLEIKARQVEHNKRELERDIGQLKDQLEHQREHRLEQERKIAVLEESMKTLEDQTKDLQSQEEQAQNTLKVYSMNTDRLQRNLEMAGEESTVLQESNAQLRQQAEGWAERVSELEAEIRRCEVAYAGMQQDVANKDERIMSLTDHLLRMKAWDSDLEKEESEEEEKKEASNGRAAKLEGENEDITDTQGHLQKVQKLIYAAKLNADLKSLDEDKNRVFAKLNDEVKAKEDLHESIKEMENEKLSLQSDAEQYSDQVQRLQQKLHIMTEMYQENELKLHRLLTVEERERLQKEEKLNKADKNIALAIEEVNNYRQRAEEMEEELEKTKQSYQTQISAHEKKAHNNWLAARAAERDLADIRRENALLRQKLTDTQFKLDAIDKDPYALDSLARPLPFRAERSPYGPSPLGRPASETRPFLSPPTLMDGPPARLSPRSYMLTDAGGPMYRRPPPPGAVGILLPPGSVLPGPPLHHPRGFPSGPPTGPPHSTDIVDGPYSENNTGPIEQPHRESGSGDRRTPPEVDLKGGPLPPGPPMGPMDGPFPRRTLYGPPPSDFYPPRGPGGPAMRPMWGPPPSGMMFPPRFPPSGPPLLNAPHPHYAPAMRPPVPDRLPPHSMGPPPPQQPLPFPPHSQSSEEHVTSPEDAI
ncbi:transport and Golgi organization protein 1 homolog isoform X2 [Betta splendens]|uniref:Transport and Golgi organization protein 1 homolog isoform X2 n=1 Tax=Betta splendens TaxID=158456 RepID=A0A9W2XI10_BETSP|nr:transport and Golgi organization protein 1 homolog isoform X2 [Betta splendens]